MDKALWDSDRAVEGAKPRRGLDWRRKMSDHIAYALLVYTGLQIWVTMGALKSAMSSILPYLALIVLVAAIIPGCRMFEKRWEDMSDSEAADPAYEPRFKRDRALVWIAAIALPLLLTGLFRGIASIL